MNRASTLHAKCCVPTCSNTTTNSRNKLFVVVRETMKREWCKILNIDYKAGRQMLCCEEHLNLEQDLENYQYMKLMKGRPVLKSTARPRLQKLPVYQDTGIAQHNMPSTSTEEPTITLNQYPTSTSTATHTTKVDAVTQCKVEMQDKSTSTRNVNLPSVSLEEYISSSTQEYTLSTTCFVCSSETETTMPTKKNPPQYLARKQHLEFIFKDPKAYLGLPKQYLWLVKYIVDHTDTNVKELDIYITLQKIKLNDPVKRLCDNFEISQVTFTKSFHSGITILANFFQNLVFMPSLLEIKLNQPLAFKIRYSNVQMLLDAFEIEIQKPSNPKHQAQTWSQYKNANTVKYLVGSTPNGLISYVSKGFGGRISDKALVEKSDLIEKLKNNTVIMADRGFKEIEACLAAKGIKLLRPPSVFTSSKPTKEEVIQTKVIASLRVHIERVIRRIREFRFLKPHSVISHKHVGYLDHIVLITCGLINLQNEIIKRE